MATGAENAPKAERDHDGPTRAAQFAVAAGLGAGVLGAVALWASQGAEVFLVQAFAALAACF